MYFKVVTYQCGHSRRVKVDTAKQEREVRIPAVCPNCLALQKQMAESQSRDKADAAKPRCPVCRKPLEIIHEGSGEAQPCPCNLDGTQYPGPRGMED